MDQQQAVTGPRFDDKTKSPAAEIRRARFLQRTQPRRRFSPKDSSRSPHLQTLSQQNNDERPRPNSRETEPIILQVLFSDGNKNAAYACFQRPGKQHYHRQPSHIVGFSRRVSATSSAPMPEKKASRATSDAPNAPLSWDRFETRIG